ncbi:MAG: ABC transporter ATP-binding protein [Candidatus Omnitrophota bacterium]
MSILLEIKNLRINFRQGGRIIEAVRGADLKVEEAEILGLVGESGSGKSVTALSVTRLLPKSAIIASGEILFKGRDLLKLKEDGLRNIRGSNISYVFQDPATSLNPVLTVGEQITEVIKLHQALSGKSAFAKAVDSLKEAGMSAASDIMFAYPHQLSGGMKQRVMIAMAISCKPDLLIADEPTTALDVTIQAQILDLLDGLRRELKLAVILITHDLSIVARLADKTAVMRAGEIVEYGKTKALYEKPAHPYTKKLIECLPKLGGGKL